MSRAAYLRTVYGEVMVQQMPLADNIEFFTQLRHFEHPAAVEREYCSGFAEAVNDFMFDLMRYTGKWFEETVRKAIDPLYTSNWLILPWLAYVEAQLKDPMLANALKLVKEAFDQDREDCCDREQLMLAYQWVRLNLIRDILKLNTSHIVLADLQSMTPIANLSPTFLERVWRFSIKTNGRADYVLIHALTKLGSLDDIERSISRCAS